MNWWRVPGLAWVLACALVCVPALWVGVTPLNQPGSWHEWALRPTLGWQQPVWVLWTAAWLHGSAQHLALNALGLSVLAGLGWQWRLSPGWAACLLLAWPLCQLGLLLDPRLTLYLGASAFLHAGVTLWLFAARPSLNRVGFGLALLALLGKVAWEAWSAWGAGPTLIRSGADVPLAPWSHVSGVTVGLLLAGIHGAQTRDIA
jgi:membrane associated rhomboid family serine protease